MLNNLEKLKKKTNQSGFTIIEVMIVLAIAGLIILIVLLAVPALQRNARNTSTKSEASSLAAGIAEYKANNDGTAPPNGSITGTGTVTIGAAGTAQATVKLQGNTTPAQAGAATSAGPVAYTTGNACPPTSPSARTVAVYYWVETAGGGISKCIDT